MGRIRWDWIYFAECALFVLDLVPNSERRRFLRWLFPPSEDEEDLELEFEEAIEEWDELEHVRRKPRRVL